MTCAFCQAKNGEGVLSSQHAYPYPPTQMRFCRDGAVCACPDGYRDRAV